MAVLVEPTELPVIGDVAEDQKTARATPRRSFADSVAPLRNRLSVPGASSNGVC